MTTGKSSSLTLSSPKQAFIVVLVSFAVYANTLANGFVFDDIYGISANPWIRDIKYLPQIFSSNVAGFDSRLATSYYRPLLHVIYMFCYHIFGLKPWGFHFVNIIFHAGVVMLVFLVVRELTEKQYPAQGSDILPGGDSPVGIMTPPFIAALLFAVHPIHTEAVAWISGVMDLSFSFFFLLSFYLYIRSGGRSDGNYFLSVGSFFLATLCKEPALTLPIILLTYDHLFKKERIFAVSAITRFLPFLAVAVIYFSLRFRALGGFAPTRQLQGMGVYQHLINIFPLFIQYVEKVVMPLNLSALHVFLPVTSVFEPRAFIPIMLTVIFVFCSFLARKNSVVFLGIMLFAVPLLPALYIAGLGERVFAERYLYLPSFGFVMLAALALGRAYAVMPQRSLFVGGVLLMLVGFCSVGTVIRNAEWKDNYSLWSAEVKKFPENAAAHEHLAYAFYEGGQLDKAIEHYRAALVLKPDYEDAMISLAAAYESKGKTDDAIAEYLKALKIRPNNAEVHNRLGLAYAKKGWTGSAVGEYLIAIALSPYFADTYNNLGIAYGNEGRIDEAIEYFAVASRLKPDNQNYRKNLSLAYEIKARSQGSKSREGRGK